MKKTPDEATADEMRAEYDFRGGVRGNYAERYAQGTNVVILTSEMSQPPVVHSHPEIVSGEPVFVGTRVPARNLLDWIAGGHTIDEFVDNFPSVSRDQAVAFLEEAGEALLSGIERAA